MRLYLATFRGPENQFVSYSIFHAANHDVAFRQAELLGVGVQRALERPVDSVSVDEWTGQWLHGLSKTFNAKETRAEGGGT